MFGSRSGPNSRIVRLASLFHSRRFPNMARRTNKKSESAFANHPAVGVRPNRWGRIPVVIAVGIGRVLYIFERFAWSSSKTVCRKLMTAFLIWSSDITDDFHSPITVTLVSFPFGV